MNNEDLVNIICPTSSGLKCVDVPKSGKEQRRERRKQELRKRKGRL